MNEGRIWLAAGLAALVLAAPVAFGSTERIACLALSLGFSCLALAALAAGARPSGSWPMALLLILPCAQLVPLPAGLLAAISPQAGRLHTLAAETTGPDRAATSWRPVSLDPDATLTGVLLLGSAASLFGVARFCLTHPAVRRLLAGLLVATGMFEASYGLAGHLGGSQEILGWRKTHYLDSATGTFVNRNHYAGYLEMTLMVSLGILIALSGRADGVRRGGTSGHRLARLVVLSTPRGGAALLLAIATCVMVAGLLFSRSRAGIVSAGVGLCVLTILSGRGKARRFAMSLIAIVVIVGALYAVAAGAEPLMSRFDRTMQDLTGSQGRLPLWGDAARSAAAFAATGSGLLAFEQVFPALRTREDPQLRRHAHNDYLEVAAELGLPGLALALLLVARFFRETLRGSPPALGVCPSNGSGPSHYSDTLLDGADALLAQGCALGGVAAAAALAFHSFFDFNLHVPANLLTLSLVCALALPAPRLLSRRPQHSIGPVPVPS
ncbi:MAG TPA: O-antigen ligase family protein [Candidatus Polarisedimenticolia bacterium]